MRSEVHPAEQPSKRRRSRWGGSLWLAPGDSELQAAMRVGKCSFRPTDRALLAQCSNEFAVSAPLLEDGVLFLPCDRFAPISPRGPPSAPLCEGCRRASSSLATFNRARLGQQPGWELRAGPLARATAAAFQQQAALKARGLFELAEGAWVPRPLLGSDPVTPARRAALARPSVAAGVTGRSWIEGPRHLVGNGAVAAASSQA